MLDKNIKKVTTEDKLINDMFNAGAHYGYSKTRRHPSMYPYIYSTQNGTDIINLLKTKSLAEEAAKFIKELASKNKVILFVGTKPEAKKIVKAAAESLGLPYVTERWIGGTLTNFSQIKKRLLELEKYQKENASNELDKYTKKERLILRKKMEKLSRYFFGILSLKKIPDALFIVDIKSENTAKTEGNKTKVPIIALANSDSDINSIDYPIVANDANVVSIKFFTDLICEAYKEGQNQSDTLNTSEKLITNNNN